MNAKKSKEARLCQRKAATRAREIKEVAKWEFHLEPNILVLQSCHQAQNAPTPYAVFSIILDGELLCDHQISKIRFRNIMKKRLQPESQRP